MYHSGQLPMSNGIYENRLHRARWQLFDPETRTYLHLSGTGTTSDATYAWSGTVTQARTLHERAMIRREPWPWQLLHPETRDLFEVAA